MLTVLPPPQVKVNFPMPPALQMLQDLLGGDSSSEDEEVVEKPESGGPHPAVSQHVH